MYKTNHYIVISYTSRPNKINNTLEIVNQYGDVIHKGQIHKSTSDPKEAFSSAEFIFVTVPAMLMNDIAATIEPYVTKDTAICLVPGTGGGECAFKGCLNKNASIWGLQRVPSVARLLEYGKTVRAVGYRNDLYVASIPKSKSDYASHIIESLFDIKTHALPNYLNITLTPSNPILHTSRCMNLFKEWSNGIKYKEVPLFYEDWNDESSDLLLKCDAEVQNICERLSPICLSYVKSLKEHYESKTSHQLTAKIRSIIGFKGLKSPSIAVEDGFVPDFNSRYFQADFPYGLAILIQIAHFVNLRVPNMEKVYEWYNSVSPSSNAFSYRDYGINNYNDFIDFYTK